MMREKYAQVCQRFLKLSRDLKRFTKLFTRKVLLTPIKDCTSLIKISYTDHVLSHQKLDLLSRAKRLTQDISSSNFLVT